MIQVQQHGSVTAIRMARTFLGRPLYWTTAYWLDGLLIDSGPPCLTAELAYVLQNLAVDQVVITHAHEDHIGSLHWLRQRYPNVKIYASPRSIPLIQEPQLLHPQLYRRLLWGVPKAFVDVELLPLVVETPQFKLRVVETPGHSQDHVSFFEAKHRWLFTGDAFIGGKDRSWAADYEMFGVISSLRTLSSLRPERIFPGSGNVRRTALPEICGKIGQLLELCQSVARLDAEGLPTDEIVLRLLNGETRIRFWTQGHFSGVNLVQACRRYNEIFNPIVEADEVQQTPSPHHKGQKPDSSPSESADQSDWRTAK